MNYQLLQEFTEDLRPEPPQDIAGCRQRMGELWQALNAFNIMLVDETALPNAPLPVRLFVMEEPEELFAQNPDQIRPIFTAASEKIAGLEMTEPLREILWQMHNVHAQYYALRFFAEFIDPPESKTIVARTPPARLMSPWRPDYASPRPSAATESEAGDAEAPSAPAPEPALSWRRRNGITIKTSPVQFKPSAEFSETWDALSTLVAPHRSGRPSLLDSAFGGNANTSWNLDHRRFQGAIAELQGRPRMQLPLDQRGEYDRLLGQLNNQYPVNDRPFRAGVPSARK